MKLIVGLGNPGKQYEKTRHNVGFQIADSLQTAVSSGKEWEFEIKFNADVCRPKAADVLLAKPQTFMNDSGRAVQMIASFYKIAPLDIWIIHDDLDIRLGEYKVEKGHGPKLHYGINSIEKALGSESFWRVRIGVDNRQPDSRIPGEDYVLQPFTDDEFITINKIIDTVTSELVNSIVPATG